MSLLAHLQRLFDFHHWRVQGACAALVHLEEKTLEAPLGGSFPTLRRLVQHMVWVDRLWIARVQGLPNPPIEPVEALAWSELLAAWQQQAIGWQQRLAQLTEAELAAEVDYVSVTLGPKRHPLADLLFQAQDHTGYHLGQLAHGLRQLGLTPPALGYAAWLWR